MEVFSSKRQFERVSHDESLELKVLFTESNELQSVNITVRIINVSPAGIGLMTDYPLEPGQVLKWADKHKAGGLHMAAVRWTQEFEGCYSAGAVLI